MANLVKSISVAKRGVLCRRHGVWRKKEKCGVKSMDTARYGVTADGDAAAMLEQVRQLQV